jgi:hypothetical protein
LLVEQNEWKELSVYENPLLKIQTYVLWFIGLLLLIGLARRLVMPSLVGTLKVNPIGNQEMPANLLGEYHLNRFGKTAYVIEKGSAIYLSNWGLTVPLARRRIGRITAGYLIDEFSDEKTRIKAIHVKINGDNHEFHEGISVDVDGFRLMWFND